MIRHLEQFKARLGPMWWYAAILFAVQRFGDVINVIIGLWLVPRYIPPAELGAVLPLAQVGGLLGLPMAILLLPFGKFLNVFAVRNERGKIKALLRDVFLLTALLGCLLLLSAHWLLPGVFNQMRVQAGLLPWLIVASGISTAIAPLFLQALQGLKKFRALSLAMVLTAPVRLVVLLVTLPIRGLSGYFAGQLAADSCHVLVSLTSLRKLLSRQIVAQAYWHEWRAIGAFVLPVALNVAARRLQTAAEFFVIRTQLSDIASAGYYFITRFAEVPMYLWGALGMVLLPLVSERFEQGQTVRPMLQQALMAILLGGSALAGLLHLVAPWLFKMVPLCQNYQTFTPLMGIATFTSVLRATIICLITYELACRRYTFVWGATVLALLEALFLYALSWITRLPLDAVYLKWAFEMFKPLTLNTIVGIFCGFAVAIVALFFLLNLRPQSVRPPEGKE